MGIRTRIALAVAAGALAVPGTAPAAPGNDAFEHAQEIPALPAMVAGDFIGSSLESGEPAVDPSIYGTVWYGYTVPAVGRLAVSLSHDGSGAPLIWAYTGSGLGDLRLLEFSASDRRVVLDAAAGQRLWIRLGQRWVDPGTASAFTLRVRPAPLPANDAFAAAQTVSPRGSYTGNLADATAELSEPHHAGVAPRHSVWFRLKARRTDKMTVDTSTSTCATRLAVYAGSKVDGLREVASNVESDDPGPARSTVRFIARRGTTYHLAVDCEDPGLDGDFALHLSDGGIVGKGVQLAVEGGQTLGTLRSTGLGVVVSTRRTVRLRMELVVSRRVARALGLRGRVLGRLGGRLDYYQSLPARIPLTGAAKAALRNENTLRADVRLTLLGSRARNRVLTVPFTLSD
jgi:hypothetical protein